MKVILYMAITANGIIAKENLSPQTVQLHYKVL